MSEQEKLDDSLKLLAKGSIIFFIGMVVSKIATYLYNFITVRTFGQETYGLFSLTLMVSGLFLAFFSFGLQSGILRYISFYRGKDEKEKINYIIHFSLRLTLLLSIIGGVLLFSFSDIISINIFHNAGLSIFLKLFSIFIPLSLISGIFHTILRSYEIIGWYSFIGNILLTSVQLILLIVFASLNLKNNAIIFSYILGMSVMFFSAFLVCKYKLPGIFKRSSLKKDIKKNLTKELLSYSWPIMFMGLIVSVFSYIDSFSIGYFRTISEVGLYNIAVPISLFLQVVPLLFLQLFFPIITKEYSKGNINLIKDLSKQISKWIFILNLPLLAILILFPGAVISLLFGPEFVPASFALRFLSIGIFFYALFSVSDNLLSMAGKSRTSLRNFGISTVVNIVLNVLLVPKLGIIGAAISNMSGYTLWAVLSLVSAKKFVRIIPLKKGMIKILLIALFSSLVLLFIRSVFKLNKLTIILSGTFFILLYFFLILITKSFDENDFTVLKEFKNKFMRKS